MQSSKTESIFLCFTIKYNYIHWQNYFYLTLFASINELAIAAYFRQLASCGSLAEMQARETSGVRKIWRLGDKET